MPIHKKMVIFTFKTDKARQLLKSIWSIIIDEHFCLTPGYFQRSHMENRNRHVAKFLGFDKSQHTLALLLDILKS